jgi:hypothetical protein
VQQCATWPSIRATNLRRLNTLRRHMKTQHSLIELIIFCAACALAAGLGFALLLATATVAFAGGDPVALGEDGLSPQAAQTVPSGSRGLDATGSSAAHPFSGLITDEICGSRHDMGSGRTSAECANLCARKGAKYALVDGDKKFTLDGNQDDLAKLAGQRVNIAGILTGDNIKITSIGAPYAP